MSGGSLQEGSVMRRSTVALACSGLLVLALAGCGGGQPRGGPSGTATVVPGAPGTALTIELNESGAGAARAWNLTCEPAGGDHPDPAGACTALRDAGGVDAFAPLPKDAVCTEIYGGPQTATVRGTVDGKQVTAQFSRTNGCEIARWDALAPLLGSGGGASS
jgi:hypothetical protein